MRFRLISALNHIVAAEMLGLPLRARDGSDIHILGSVIPFRDTELLGYDRVIGFEISSARIIWTEPVPDRPPFAPSEHPLRASLRLINGGRAN